MVHHEEQLPGAFPSAEVQTGRGVRSDARSVGREATQLLDAVMESSADAIIGKTLEGTITSWNASAERIYGFTAQEAIGRPIAMLVPPERLGEIPRFLETVGRGERVAQHETVRLRKDGQLIDVSLSITPIRNERGQVIGALTLGRDISEHKRDEAALLAAKVERERQIAELRTILDNVTEGVVVASLDGHRFYWNPAAVNMYGFAGLEECLRAQPRFTELLELTDAEGSVLPLEQWPLARILCRETLQH